MSFSTDYASLLNAGPCAMELYNAHMAVPGAGPYGVTGHCRVCDGLPCGTISAAYVTAPAAEADLLGLFDPPTMTVNEAFGAGGIYREDYLRALSFTQMGAPDGQPKWKGAHALDLVHRLNGPNPPTVASAVEAMEAFIEVSPRPAPLNTTASAFDQLAAKALSAPVMATSVPFIVAQDTERLAARIGIPKSDAEATMAYLYPDTGYTKNLLLAMKAINRFATEHGITPAQAEIVLRD